MSATTLTPSSRRRVDCIQHNNKTQVDSQMRANQAIDPSIDRLSHPIHAQNTQVPRNATILTPATALVQLAPAEDARASTQLASLAVDDGAAAAASDNDAAPTIAYIPPSQRPINWAAPIDAVQLFSIINYGLAMPLPSQAPPQPGKSLASP